MKRKKQTAFSTAACLLTAFGLWTAALYIVDVQAIGPQGSSVGFAALNRFVHALTGVHMGLYVVTDWLGLVPLGTAAGFAVLGLAQWIQRKQLRRVDRSLLILGGFYVVVIAAYLIFDALAINYRPVLIDGVLEASYPSTTTLLVLCIMPTAGMQLHARIKNPALRGCTLLALSGFTLFMVTARALSGVHWITDIIGSILLSGGLVMLYAAVCCPGRDQPANKTSRRP